MKRSLSRPKTASQGSPDPFGREADSRFYYAFEAFEQRLVLLRRLIDGADALILVIGERGSGKTTLLNRFLSTTDKPWKSCRVQTAVSAAVGSLSRLKQRGHPSAFLLQAPGGNIVLMDDTHQLSKRELRKLLRNTLSNDPNRRFKRLVLFGEPRISVMFRSLTGSLIDETALNKIYLPTISEQEAVAYIRHRLAVAGFDGKNPITPTILKTLYEKADGWPGRLNEEAARWWSKQGFGGSGSAELSRHSRSRFIRLTGWSAAVITAVVLAGVMWPPGGTDRSPGSRSPAEPQMVRVKIQKQNPRQSPRPRQADIAPPAPGAKQTPARLKPSEAQPSGMTPRQSSGESLSSKPSSAAASSAKPPQKDLKDRLHREDWLLKQSPSDYTIQILGVRNERSLLMFVAEHRLDRSGLAAYYRSRFKGKIWFPLVYGTYPTVEDAQLAIAGLPERIRRMSPWIRKMAVVQTEIQAFSRP